ncbi:MAG: hypothetical protein NTV51_11585 [Verrucomicrobia bacterium]|nr:hypothetical protein [Verrucomicrobiota bacterium]
MNPNARLTLLRALAVLLILPGAGLIVWAVAFGVQRGGYAWLLAAVFVFLGGLFVAIPVRFFRKPTQNVAADILTACSLIGFGALSNGLRTVSPDAWGLPQK